VTRHEEATAKIEADVEILSGSPDSTDMAAVTAVLAGVLEELAAEQGRRQLATTSAWERSQRSVREPLHPQAGAWRSFSG
jgi:hypothetical protein